jgi:glycosyltransferase involved in cell wall biosynthesis
MNFRGPLLEALVRKGYAVHVTAPDISQNLAKQLHEMGVTSHNLALKRTSRGLTSDIAYAWALLKLMRAIKPDRVLGYTVKPNIWGSLAAALARIPSFSWVTGLGYLFIEGDGMGRKLTQVLAQRLYRVATRCNTNVIFQNPDDQADFIEKKCLSDISKAAMVNGSGVDTDHFSVCPLPTEPIFLLIARLLRSKGVLEFAEACKQLRTDLPDARFQIAGMIDEGPDALGLADVEAMVAAGVEYLGELKDVRPALAACSVYVLPSWREGTPRTVLEAMAMGRPIITTDAPGCRQTTRDGENGILVPVNDPKRLAEAMRQLAVDPALRSRFGEYSRQRAEDIYSVGKVNDALMAIMQV